MYQTVGVEITPLIAQCLNVPIVRRQISGKALNQDLQYKEGGKEDEVEDLYELLKDVKAQFPEVQAVASGAIFSHYQRLRVENICQRLGYFSLAYLWLRDQSELLDEMIEHRIEAQIVKVCSMGLKSLHLGKTIGQLRDHFAKLASQFDFNVCGEGGEYESAVFDCPIFSKRIVCSKTEIVMHEDNPVCEVAYLQYKELALEEKSPEELKNDKELMDQLR